MYCRYVDDIFVSVSTNKDLNTLRNRMQEISGLNFTIEYSINNRIPFLDVLVSNDDGYLNTTVYRKPTDAGKCLNGNSECTNDYIICVLRAYIHRALKVCSTWEQMHTELTYIRQMVVNNGYSNAEFDRVCKDMMEKHLVE